MLTKKQLRAAAAASRELAMECINGTAPRFRTGLFIDSAGKTCACGAVAVRAGVRDFCDMETMFWTMCSDATWAVVVANDVSCRPDADASQKTEIVFPLLWLGDALEIAAEAATRKPFHDERS